MMYEKKRNLNFKCTGITVALVMMTISFRADYVILNNAQRDSSQWS